MLVPFARWSARATIALPAALVLVLSCTAHPAPSADNEAAVNRRDATVFTDTALYRKLCVEADSGLTPKSGRCTPRDQGLRRVRPLPEPSKRP